MKIITQLYWSAFSGPLRSVWRRPHPPASDTRYWDGQLSGKFASRLGHSLSIDTRNEMIAQLVGHQMKSPKSVLDIGCAAGSLSAVLLSRGFESYVGVDISPLAVETATKANRDPRVSFELGTAQKFETEKRFDLIVMSEILYYVDIEDIAAVIRTQLARLTPKGALCISLNLHPKSQAIQRVLGGMLRYVSGFMYQEKTGFDSKIRDNRERPLYHTFLAVGN
ncbi:MAG: methyltransferase domain-containing protein [Proteobacteria bacterium]|nr:methyltransferase domain-containing protein [Pseudomonadota bacterium]